MNYLKVLTLRLLFAHLGVRGTLLRIWEGRRWPVTRGSALGPFPGGAWLCLQEKWGEPSPPVSIPHSGHPLQLH